MIHNTLGTSQHFSSDATVVAIVQWDHYWYTAGQKASERSAHVEAIAHLHQGLKLLKTLPETSERTQREVAMLLALGASLLAVKGYAASEVRETYTYARQLCQHLEDPSPLRKG